MAAQSRIQLADADGVRVVRFVDRRLVDDPVVREVADQVFAALPAQGPILAVLDMSAVEQISSAMLGKLIVMLRRVDASGGRLRLCELNPTIEAVLRTTNLDRLFAVDRDRRSAVEAVVAAARR